MSHGHEFLYGSTVPTRIGTVTQAWVPPRVAPDERAGHGLVPWNPAHITRCLDSRCDSR